MEKGSESVAGEPRGRAAIYSVELELFEGPLGLCLQRRHKLANSFARAGYDDFGLLHHCACRTSHDSGRRIRQVLRLPP